MPTTLAVIEDALREINVISEVDSASSEQGSFALRKLNQMMALWEERDINNLGWYPQPNTSGTIPIPDYAELAVTTGLAIALAPKYGASISAELAAVAQSAFSTVQRKSISEKLDNADMSHLPFGTAETQGRYDIERDS
jgi:hypothetical protein